VSTVKYRLLGENIVQYNTAEGEIGWENCGGQSMSVASLSLDEHEHQNLAKLSAKQRTEKLRDLTYFSTLYTLAP
jgi:hypothetical protein